MVMDLNNVESVARIVVSNDVELGSIRDYLARAVLEMLPAVRDAEHVTNIDELLSKHIVRVLERFKGNKTEAAKALGISRRSIYRYLEKINGKPETVSE